MKKLFSLIAVAFAFIIWYGFYLFNKKEAKKLNQKLEAMNK